MSITGTCVAESGWQGDFVLPWGDRQITVLWRVTTDSAWDGPLYVLANAKGFGGTYPCAQLGDIYAVGNDPSNYLVAKQVSISRGTNEYEWHYRVTYSEWGLHKDGMQAATPSSRPTRYWIENEQYTEVVESDKNGAPITNSAKQPFDPPPERDAYRNVYVIERNETSFTTIATRSETYVNTVNSTAVTINGHSIGARKGLMRPMVVTPEQSESNEVFYTVQYRIAENPNEWKETPVDQGMKYLDGGVLKAPTDQHGDFMFGEPVLLNGTNGAKLADGATGVLLDGLAGRIGPYYLYEETDFTTLSL